MKNKHKNKFDLTVAKTCDKKKLAVSCIRYTTLKNNEENKMH